MRGQADAVKLGIARALMQFNAELRKKLKAEGMVSRDSRGKERKKYGQKGARKRFQFSKTIVSSFGTTVLARAYRESSASRFARGSE